MTTDGKQALASLDEKKAAIRTVLADLAGAAEAVSGPGSGEGGSFGLLSQAASANEPTILLSVIGISSVSGRGSARVNIVATGDSR